MANTTSGTVTFDKTFAIDEIIEEAYERIGMQGTSGYQLKTARRSLNILFQEWGNRGIHFWEVGDTNIDFVEGQATYTFLQSNRRRYKFNNSRWYNRHIYLWFI